LPSFLCVDFFLVSCHFFPYLRITLRKTCSAGQPPGLSCLLWSVSPLENLSRTCFSLFLLPFSLFAEDDPKGQGISSSFLSLLFPPSFLIFPESVQVCFFFPLGLRVPPASPLPPLFFFFSLFSCLRYPAFPDAESFPPFFFSLFFPMPSCTQASLPWFLSFFALFASFLLDTYFPTPPDPHF